MTIQEFLISAPAIIAVVTWLKDAGMPSGYARIAAPIVGIALALIANLALYAPSFTQLDTHTLIWQCVQGFFYGIGGAGIYDAATLATRTTRSNTTTSSNTYISLDDFLDLEPLTRDAHPATNTSANNSVSTSGKTGRHKA